MNKLIDTVLCPKCNNEMKVNKNKDNYYSDYYSGECEKCLIKAFRYSDSNYINYNLGYNWNGYPEKDFGVVWAPRDNYTLISFEDRRQIKIDGLLPFDLTSEQAKIYLTFSDVLEIFGKIQ